LGNCYTTTCRVVQCLRLWTHSKQIPHQWHTYSRWLRTFICCGWAHGPVLTLFPCPSSDKLLEDKLEFWVTATPQTVGCALFEAMDPLQTDPTSMPYICKVFENLHMLWMGTWTCPHSVPHPSSHKFLEAELELWVSATPQPVGLCIV